MYLSELLGDVRGIELAEINGVQQQLVLIYNLK